MIQKIKNLVMAISLLAVFAAPVLAPAVSYAQSTQQQTINGNLCAGSNFNLSGTASPGATSDCTTDSNSLSGKIKTILNVFSALIGIVAVVMIIYAGFRYVTSAGSEGGVKTAKNAIIYAIIGLVIVAIAQVIVHFVISQATS
ncbi:MAG TPA: pilin [Candidatus Saccharimonadales bacterium]|nr:pilin [Candidatus Saccharimonadales bacterium]